MSESTATQYTTARLLARVREGDGPARAALVARVEPLLRRFAQGRVPQLLRHEQDTADLVQLTWTRVLTRLDQIETQASGDFFAYLRSVLINALREALRRHGRAPVKVDGELAEHAEAMLSADNVDPVDWLTYEQSLASLSSEHRTLVLLRFEFGMSFAEIAAELDETTDGVRMKLKRAIARMAGAVHDDAERR